MPKIAVIDDNPELGGTLRRFIEHYLRKFGSSFTVLYQYPFKDVRQYLEYISSNDICLLILDERLNDQITPEGSHVDYRGNQLVISLRQQLKDFPIVMITTYSDDEDLREKESEFEYLLSRDEIISNEETANIHIPRMIRAAQRFLDSNNNELAEYGEISKQVAAGNTNPELLNRLKALQTKLELPLAGFDDRAVWLDEYERHINELEALRSELDIRIKEE